MYPMACGLSSGGHEASAIFQKYLNRFVTFRMITGLTGETIVIGMIQPTLGPWVNMIDMVAREKGAMTVDTAPRLLLP
jgi:hypothetical protein